MANIIIAIRPSRIRQELGFFISGIKNFAPYERLKNHTKLAKHAPQAKATLLEPEKFCETEPISIIVSR